MTSQTSKTYAFYGSTMNGWKVIVHRVSRTPPKSTKFELQEHPCHSQDLWSKGTRFMGFGTLLPLLSPQNLSFSFSKLFPVFLPLNSLDFSLPDSLGIFELHKGFCKAPSSASHFSKNSQEGDSSMRYKRDAARCADSSTTSASVYLPVFGHIFQVMALKASFWLCIACPIQVAHRPSQALPYSSSWCRSAWSLQKLPLAWCWWTYSPQEPACTGCHAHHESATKEQNWCCCTEACTSVHFEVSLSVLMIWRRTCPQKILHNSLSSGPIP